MYLEQSPSLGSTLALVASAGRCACQHSSCLLTGLYLSMQHCGDASEDKLTRLFLDGFWLIGTEAPYSTRGCSALLLSIHRTPSDWFLFSHSVQSAFILRTQLYADSSTQSLLA